jgi:predicted lysophospholipase L1 biosynthesis ABC-type transport system permease subunit
VSFVGPEEPWREVIGVIGDVKHWGLDVEVNPELYLPHDQLPSPNLTYVLHTSGDPMSVAGAVADAVKAVDPLMPLTSVRTMEDVAARSVGVRRWSALLLGMFAALGLALAAAGIYGVMAHLVSMRTGEIGIRMTLGARPAGVLSQVLREALTHAAIGLVIGLVAAALAMRGAKALLFEIDSSDPLTFAATIAAVLAISGLAAIIPAVRAMRVDPLSALRAE